MITLRAANMRDADRLFAWRNDPVTRACSRSTGEVSQSDHGRWMEFNVAHGYPEHLVIVAEHNLVPIGVVRFDASKGDLMTYSASITIDPKHRGMGYAIPILDEACLYMGEYTIDAEIRLKNATSRKVFERCGFEQISIDGDFVRYRKAPAS